MMRLLIRVSVIVVLVVVSVLTSLPATADTAPGLRAAARVGVGVGAGPASIRAAVPDATAVDFEMVANLDELTEQHATLFRLYWAFFLREPDGPGALYWVERQERCDELGAIADEFAAGTEFVNRYGDLDDRAFVRRIYRNVLGRTGEAAGLRYWTDLVVDKTLTRGEMVLYVSQSREFRGKHRYPSDGVPSRSCRLPKGSTPTTRSMAAASGDVLATVSTPAASGSPSALTIVSPAAVVEKAGFHQSSHPGALPMIASSTGSTDVPRFTMPSRNRGTNRTGAVDIAVHPLVPITAPVSGTVDRAGNYVLYCTYRDGYVVINPDHNPKLEVKVLHIQDVTVRAGQRVEVGDRIAARSTPFPFRSQLDAYTAEPSWPHVHIETVDPSVPRRPSSGGGC